MIVSLPTFANLPEPPWIESSFWKLNTSVLKDEDFLHNFADRYKKWQSSISDYSDIADWWDHCAKPNIKQFCIGVSSCLSEVRRDTKKFLFSYLKFVLKNGQWEEVARVKQQLKDILQEEAFGYVVRSRHKGSLEAEAASLYHVNRENKNFKKNN